MLPPSSLSKSVTIRVFLLGYVTVAMWATANTNLCAHVCSSSAWLRVLSGSTVTAFRVEASLCACPAKISCQRQHIAVNIDTKPFSGILQSHYSSVNGHGLYFKASHNMRRISSGDLVVNCLKYTFFRLVSLKINYRREMKLLICSAAFVFNEVIKFTLD
jgi:hypothetical protein